MSSTTTALSPTARAEAIARMEAEELDILVIGGGVVGAGTALDAVTRGLKVGLLEARDYAAGTSSRSSKLFHGGLRYLEQFNFSLVFEALKERSLVLNTLCPHLARPVPFIYPLEKVIDRPYVGLGIGVYDVMLPGRSGLDLVDDIRGDADLRRVPVILLTARAGTDFVLDGLGRGADDYIVKPFHDRELVARVRVHLELSRMREQLIAESGNQAATLRTALETRGTIGRAVGILMSYGRTVVDQTAGLTDGTLEGRRCNDVNRDADADPVLDQLLQRCCGNRMRVERGIGSGFDEDGQ